MGTLDIRLFGPPAIRIGEAPLPPLRTRKGLWLLCLLALRAGREVDRSWLAGVLWPESLQEDALANLRRSLTDLRRALGSVQDALCSPSQATLMLRGAAVDVVMFDALAKGDSADGWREALALGSSLLLEGCDEDWVVDEREQRNASCIALAEKIAENAFSEAHYTEAADWFSECIRRDPFRESAWRRRMQALERGGSGAAALECYRALRDQLWSSLHASPSPETTAVYQAIRRSVRQRSAEIHAIHVTHRMASDAVALAQSSQPSPASLLSAGIAAEPAGSGSRVPSPLTSLIGREEELRRATGEIRSARLVTLTGSGGVGKTRLAQEAALAVAGDFPAGVWWVELASLDPHASESRIQHAIGAALGLREEPGMELADALLRRTGGERALLVLDNCEHLVDQTASVVRVLLQRASDLAILITTRQALEVAGERVLPIQPFAVSEGPEKIALEIGRLPAVRLFVERATARDPSFSLTAVNAGTVLDICRRLDGIPLAIELAASRVPLLGAEQIAHRLTDRFRLLTGGQRSALPHHRTLRSLIDWSYGLLPPDEARLFRMLGSFAGGCTLEAALEIWSALSRPPGSEGDELDLLDLLNSLLSRSLIQVMETDRGRRYWMLESIREYARERLQEEGEWEAAMESHAEWCIRTAARWQQTLDGPEQSETLRRFRLETDNFRAALDRLSDGSRLLTLTVRLWKLWQMGGRYSEGRMRLEHAIEKSGDEVSAERIIALRAAGTMARMQGDFGGARAFIERALALCAAPEFRAERAAALTALGVVDKDQGDLSAARLRYEQALRMQEELADEAGMCATLNNLGLVTMLIGDLEEARRCHSRALDLRTARGDTHGVCSSLLNLASVAYYAGDKEEAHSWFARVEEISRESEFSSILPTALVNMAVVEGERGEFGTAELRLREAIELRTKTGDRRGLANALGAYAQLFVRWGEATRAVEPFSEAIRLVREVGDRRESCFLLEVAIEMSVARGQSRRAARLLGGVMRLRDTLRYPLAPVDQPQIDALENSLRDALGPAEFETEWTAGSGAAWDTLMEDAAGAA